MKDITYRQDQILHYLMQQFIDGNREYISKEDIATNIGMDINRHTTRLLRTIEAEVRIINENDNVEFIIVSNSKGYKIGTPSEVREYIGKRFKRDLKNLKLNWKLTKKASMDRQLYYDLFNEELKEIMVYQDDND